MDLVTNNLFFSDKTFYAIEPVIFQLESGLPSTNNITFILEGKFDVYSNGIWIRYNVSTPTSVTLF